MDQQQIREIIKITLDELEKRKQLANPYQNILSAINTRFYRFFNSDRSDTELFNALRNLSDDEYIDIIYFHYRDGKTLEWIAEYYGKDTSTIKRNKKRLILQIYNYLED